ncbi:hypothetical protein SAMN04487936_10881 [Halobacillus dabanensis]|uniref:Uncharacterized protein n=1 Tax=Halobacillus dabanensis TaxID=240302 RepID=A0A1I3X9I6_HALDA|nr:hypothetical protein [Halobacillus dabanensis]SFK16303.1 hypothetical protein SAMN04487936_10881 [Halobacillus dabanensis]
MAQIIFKHLTVDQIRDASGIYSGTNIQSKYKANERRFEGNGKIVGDQNLLQHNKHLIIKRPDCRGK